MSILKSLDFATVEPPKASRSAGSLKDNTRAKFLAALDNQIKCAEAFVSGETSYTVTKRRYVTQDDGERKLTAKEVTIQPWWFSENGKMYLSPKYANKPLELTTGKPSIACGEAVADVLEVLNSVHQATVAGEFDKALETSATAARERMTKRK